MQETKAQMTPQQYAQQIANMLKQAQQECRVDVEHVSDPQAQALFETVAEVLGGAIKALEHYQNRSERAWQGQGSTETGTGSPVPVGERRRAAQEMPDYQRPTPQG